LGMDDVKGFLSHLAVNKQVSASSQNQAFKALLFVYKHVLKNEFGEIKGVARAKRRLYIPMLLSREEIELIFEHLDEQVILIAKLLYGCCLWQRGSQTWLSVLKICRVFEISGYLSGLERQ